MILNKNTAALIAQELETYLGTGRHSWVSCGPNDSVESFHTGCTLEYGGWSDKSQEGVRVLAYDDGRVWIGFNFGHYFFPLQEGTRVSVDYDGVRIRFVAGNGDKRLDRIKREPGKEED